MEAKFAQCKSKYEESLSKLEGLEPLKAEFHKMFKALDKSFESNVRLKKKTRALEGDLAQLSDKVQRIKSDEEINQEHKKTIQQDIEVNHKRMNAQRQLHREKRNRIAELEDELTDLRKVLEAGSGWTSEQERQMGLLHKKQTDVEHLLEQKLTNLQVARQDIEILVETVKGVETNKVELEMELSDITAQVENNERDCKHAQSRRDRVDAELRSLKCEVEQNQLLIAEKQGYIKEGEEELASLDTKLKGAKAKMEHYLKEYDSLFQQTQKITDAINDQTRINEHLAAELNKRETEIQLKSKEAQSVKRDIDKTSSLIRHTAKRIAQTEAQRDKAEQKRLELNERNKVVEGIISASKRTNDSLQRQVDDLVKQREVLDKTLSKAEDRTRQVHDLIAIYHNTKRNLDSEIVGYKADAIRERQGIEELEEEVQRYEKESAQENQKYLNALESVKMQDLRIIELQKKIQEGDTKLKQQQNLYEAVRSDRNLYSKNLINAQEEIAEMKRRFKIMNHSIEQLKEEITGKDHALVKEHFDHHKCEKEKELLKNELSKLQKQTLSSEQIISNQETEIQKLSQIMFEAQEEESRERKEYTSIISERDLLGTQLIRRNEELASLYEKIKVQMSTLRKGQSQFDELSKQYRKLKKTAAALREERAQVEEQVKPIPALELEIIRLERDISQECSKVKALSDEMERPLNVHRWRQLESSDPQRFQIIRKIQAIQVKLIQKTEEVALRSAEIEEKEKLYVELKNVLARQPGPEVAEQLVLYQQNLKDKHRQMKEMSSQLNKARAQVAELKFEIDQLDQARQSLKKRYIAKKRGELTHRLREEDEDGSSSDSSSDSSDSSDSDSDSDSEDGQEQKAAHDPLGPSPNQMEEIV